MPTNQLTCTNNMILSYYINGLWGLQRRKVLNSILHCNWEIFISPGNSSVQRISVLAFLFEANVKICCFSMPSNLAFVDRITDSTNRELTAFGAGAILCQFSLRAFISVVRLMLAGERIRQETAKPGLRATFLYKA